MERKYKQKSAKDQTRNFLKLNINLDKFKIELTGEDAHRCLQEVNKILDKLNKASYERVYDDVPIDYRLESMLSDELVMDRRITKLLSTFSQLYRDYRTERIVMENRKVVEFDKGKVHQQLGIDDVKRGVRKLLFRLQKDKVRHAIIHVKGDVPEEEANKFVDHIVRELPGVEIHHVFTKGDVSSHTLVEGLFFGEFGYEYDEDMR
jgi:hypothetical protein